jgi:hypothetical protein
MTTSILALRVARRALAAAKVQNDRSTFLDGVHLSSGRERTEATVRRYLAKVLEQTAPTGVLILAPEERFDQRGSLRYVQTQLAQAGMSMRIVRLPELLHAFGVPPLRTRAQLHPVIESLLPELAHVKGAVRAYILEAAALGLYGESLLTLLSP